MEKKSLYTGLFEIENDKIVGSISDPNSPCLRHEIDGQVTHLNDRVILEFVKRPVGTSMADVFYKLEKLDGQNGITGEYEGFWSFRNQEVNQLGIGHKPGIGEAVMVIPETERENKTYLTLDSRI